MHGWLDNNNIDKTKISIDRPDRFTINKYKSFAHYNKNLEANS